MEQETLIYVEENDKAEARVLAQSFAKKETKSRAYINALGAELGMKYLALESINNSKTYNMHSVHKILEEFDISDIMLSNIHIDVRVVFDENYIFVPKSHFKYDILPDIYFVLLLSESHSHAAFLGFFEPKLINKNNQNSEYYFIEKEKLTSPLNLKSFIEGFKGNTTETLSASDNEKAELLMVSMADQNISESETKELLKYLRRSASLRDEFIEFENFELLSYKAEHTPELKRREESANDEVLDVTTDDLALSAQSAEMTEEEAVEEFAAGLVESEIGESEQLITDGMELDGLDSSGEAFLDESLTLADDAESQEALPSEDARDVLPLAGDVANGLAAAGLAGLGAAAAEDAAILGAEISSITDAAETAGDLLGSIGNIAETDGEVLNTGVEELQELNSDANDAFAQSVSVDDSFDSSASLDEIAPAEDLLPVVDNTEEMADLDVLTAKASEGTFDDASLDDLMSGTEESSELSSLESLQEDTARKRGLLPALDDESILESSLDFSKVEAVPQIDTEKQDTPFDTVDISGFDSIAPEVRLEEGSIDEESVLDISDVNAVPNNFGDNISETIEIGTIPLVDNTCENQTNVQKSQPTASLDAFGGFESLESGDMVLDESISLNDMEISHEEKPAAKKRPASPEEVDLTGFESLDMEQFERVPLVGSDTAGMAENSEVEEDLASVLLGDIDLDNLDAIPDLDVPKNLLSNDVPEEETRQDVSVHEGLGTQPPGEPEMLSFDTDMVLGVPENLRDPAANNSNTDTDTNIESLSVDDIVDSPDTSNVDVSLISQAVDMDVAQDELMSENAVSECHTEDVIQETPLNEEVAISQDMTTMESGLSDGVNSQTIEQTKDESISDDENTLPGSFEELEALSADNADLSMLFDDSPTASPTDILAENISQDDATEDNFVPSLPHMPQRHDGNSKGLFVGVAVVVAVLAGAIFFGLNMKNKNELADAEALSQPLPVPETSEQQEPSVQEDNENIMANAPDVIDMPQNQTEPKNVKPAEKKETTSKAVATGSKPVNPEGSVMSVKKLSWELPDYLSYSQEMKKYLQTAGRSIKLTLTSDLLLAKEYAYSNQVKISLKLSKDGAIQDSKVVKSSGSTEIDNIVLQTVKETLNVVKPTPGEVPTPDFNLGLIINF